MTNKCTLKDFKTSSFTFSDKDGSFGLTSSLKANEKLSLSLIASFDSELRSLTQQIIDANRQRE